MLNKFLDLMPIAIKYLIILIIIFIFKNDLLASDPDLHKPKSYYSIEKIINFVLYHGFIISYLVFTNKYLLANKFDYNTNLLLGFTTVFILSSIIIMLYQRSKYLGLIIRLEIINDCLGGLENYITDKFWQLINIALNYYYFVSIGTSYIEFTKSILRI